MPALIHPASVAAALQAGAVEHSAFIAGGTALQLTWIDAPPPANLVNLSGIAERSIDAGGDMLRIGAGATLEQCRTHPDVKRCAPLLAQACETIGAYSIRNLATLGGNIAWRLGDTLPALLASGASVELGDGSQMPLAMLLKQNPLPAPMPLLLAVLLPIAASPPVFFFEKVGHRAAFTPTVAIACGMLELDAQGTIQCAQLAVSGAGWTACRMAHAEAALAGRNARAADWHADFENMLERNLAELSAIQPHQRRVLRRLLPGRLYQLCETP
jgi:carbon-monoxide dehydrogenase medium subunit